jgi:molybdate transport system ATP-binding protein
VIAFDLRRSFDGGPSFAFSGTAAATGTTVFFGASGSGKTTLLRMIAGLETPDEGSIRFGGETWFDASSGARANAPPQQRRVGYVTQEPALFPHLDVRANVGFGVERSERGARSDELLALVGIADLARRLPGELSGGQKQRVSLARALAIRPRLLLLDEPLSALDGVARDALRRDLGRFLREARAPALLVTHDRAEALALGDDVALVSDGRIVQTGPITEVFSKPASVEAARVVGVETVLPARVTERRADGLVSVDAMGVKLAALDPGDGVDSVFACIRAEEVLLEPDDHATSARNRLVATVTALHPEGALVRVDLDCGFALRAYVTRSAERDLRLAAGSAVRAVIKAPAVHLVPRP